MSGLDGLPIHTPAVATPAPIPSDDVQMSPTPGCVTKSDAAISVEAAETCARVLVSSIYPEHNTERRAELNLVLRQNALVCLVWCIVQCVCVSVVALILL